MIEDVTTNSTKQFQIDTEDEVKSLPADVASGSSALVIDTAHVYIKSATGWKRLGGK